MFTEGTGTIFIAMGLVFVLLLGEIDLAAGYTAGVCAAVMVRLMVGYNAPWPVTIGAALSPAWSSASSPAGCGPRSASRRSSSPWRSSWPSRA